MANQTKKERILQLMKEIWSDPRLQKDAPPKGWLNDERSVVEMFITYYWRIDGNRSLRKHVAAYLKSGGDRSYVFGNPNCAKELTLDR